MARVVIPGFRKIEVSGGGEGGTTNYNDLINKPSINNVPLVGNLNTVDLKLTDSTLTEEGVPAEAKTVGAKLEEHSTSLTALSEQLGNHTVKSDVPENAVFTDTVYDDTEVKESIDELNSNLHDLSYGDSAGGKNLIDTSKLQNGYINKDYQYTANDSYRVTDFIPCYANESYVFQMWNNVENSWYNATFWNENKEKISGYAEPYSTDKHITYNFTTPSGTAYIRYSYTYNPGSQVQIEEGTTATPYEPYIPSVKMLADEVSAQKNDLDKLSSLPIGSIIQIEAAKDNIETTEQKYGWQYLGTSNIECNDGSVKLLVTNVYRKND